MTKPSTRAFLLFMAFLIAEMGIAELAKGGFYLSMHEGDTLHLSELVLRMADGERPHLDFMTPIGILAIWPLALFVKAGAGIGHAIFYSQIMVAILMLPGVLWVARTRLRAGWDLFYGATVMVLCLALVFGGDSGAISISMHYNRWAWALAYIAVPLVMIVPEGRSRPWVDGLLLGLVMALMVLVKATYFVALAPGILVALIARRWWKTMGAAALAGLAVAAVVTVALGPQFWLAYLHDLATVAASEVRPRPGEGFGWTVAGPAFIAGSLALIGSVILLRQAGRMAEGAILLFLMPGFFYVVFQNFGNDPQWLWLLAILLFALLPAPGIRNRFGWDLRTALTYAAVAALTLGAGSGINLAFSPWRHLAASTEKTAPLIPALPQHHDILAGESRIYGMLLSVAGDEDGSGFERYREKAEHPHVTLLNGEELPICEQQAGIAAWFQTVADDLTASGFGGKRILAADISSAFWMFGDFGRIPGAAPWYYGGLSGVANADYVLVPLCPQSDRIRATLVNELTEGGWTLTEVRRTPVYILLEAAAP